MEQDTNEATFMVQKCVICIKNPATDTPIRWSGRKGFICEACLEKSWECPDCSRLFYTGENNGYKPRHNVPDPYASIGILIIILRKLRL